MLRAIERAVSPDNKPKAHWAWAQPNATLELVASPNGASPDTLRRVVTLAHEGFRRAARSGGQAVVWPNDFSPEAQKHAHKILQRLPRLQQMIIEATDREPLVIDADVPIGGALLRAKPKPTRTYGSVDGVLKMLSGRENFVRAGLKEYHTGHYVFCRFDAQKWGDQLGTFWNHRVVVEGWVAYDDAGLLPL